MKVPATFEYEEKLWGGGSSLVAGIDEVGRGSWAGPVVAAAVVFPKDFKCEFDLFDSKLLLPRIRETLTEKIYKIAQVGIGQVEVEIINSEGIGKATQKAFKTAVKALSQTPNRYLIDSFYISNWPRHNQTPIKKGDRICASIAAASIVAKVYRDKRMVGLDKDYPGYGFATHKGYGTAMHQKALKKLNFSPIHRKSFNLASFV